MTTLPSGIGIAVDPDTKQLNPTTLFGGSPRRIVRLTGAGATAWQQLQRGAVPTTAARVLARRLTDAGLAHPRPPVADRVQATVVVPVRDRPELLDRCLEALGTAWAVLVVDDGSVDPDAVATVADRHGARLLRREVNGGPAAARNTAMPHVTTEFVAFVDSDCVPRHGWIQALAGHFADPRVAAVAPRILALPAATTAGRYAAQSGTLDLGPREARVVPGGRVPYVPAAALLLRCRALEQLSGAGDVFDPALRYGEDVDLIWRLHEAGWRIRYEPTVTVAHQEPDSWPALLTRRLRYGTSAAPLARRHRTAMAPVVLHVWPTMTVLALLARRPVLAAAAFIGYLTSVIHTLRVARVPVTAVFTACSDGVRLTWLGLGRYLCQFAAPLLIATLTPGGAHRWGRRAAVASLLLAPACATNRVPGLTRPATAAARLADDIAYGTGVWVGCGRERTLAPLLPALSWRALKLATTPATNERATP